MTIFKCKMCGGALEINNNETVATCEYCGTQQTLPKLDDEKRANMYDRANHFRRNNEFDKATAIYENILNEDNTDAEAYWSLALCRYGIEYVEDPTSHKRVPTVNRAQFTSIFDDDNYKSALQHADMYQRTIYENEAKAINEIQKGILAISQKEEPFDVFICYKESDNSGKRTPDSVLANDLYYQLKQEGFKVFFARITLEDKLGSAYEPYIFAALNSAKVMVVLGTKPEFFNAVWVKNEWSRYLALVKQSKGKKVLIPAYKDMDPYDLPEEFSHLQAQDMSKLGFMQDLIRGIKKIVKSDEPKTTVVKESVITNTSANTAPLIKRVFIFLEDCRWSDANEYCEKVLDMDPECADAYLGKLLAELNIQRKASLKSYSKPFDNSDNYKKILRFGNADLVAELKQYNVIIRERNEENRKAGIYNYGASLAKKQTPESQIEAAKKFKEIPGYRDADARAEECRHQALLLAYDRAMEAMNKSTTSEEYEAARRMFSEISDYYDPAKEKAEECRHQALLLAYDRAMEAMNKSTTAGEYKAAGKMFLEISDDYAPAKEKAEECLAKSKELAEIEGRNANIYYEACKEWEKGNTWGKEDIRLLKSALEKFKSIPSWRDSQAKIAQITATIGNLQKKRKEDFFSKAGIAIAGIISWGLILFVLYHIFTCK